MSSSHRGPAADASLEAAHLDEVADGVFAYIQPDGTWWINNCGALAAPDRTVVIDTCGTERRSRRMIDVVTGRTGTRVSTLVNTHHHGDHTHGNYLLDDAVVVGHEKCRDLIVEQGITHYDGVFEVAEWGDLRPRAPELTFQDSITLHVGGMRAELHHPGTAAHTTNDVVVWLPASKVLFTGDLVFNGGTPFAVMGSISGSLQAMQFLRGFGAETVVPGHGEVCGPDQIDRVESYYEFVQRTAAQAKAAGLSPLEAAREVDLGDFAGLTDPERLVANLHRAWAELDGLPPGGDIDLMGAIGDMITMNGGGPIRCSV